MPTNPFEPPKEVNAPSEWRLDSRFWAWSLLNAMIFAGAGLLLGIAGFLVVVIGFAVPLLPQYWILFATVGALIGATVPVYAIARRASRIRAVRRARPPRTKTAVSFEPLKEVT